MNLITLCNILAWILCILATSYLARDFFRTERKLRKEDSGNE